MASLLPVNISSGLDHRSQSLIAEAARMSNDRLYVLLQGPSAERPTKLLLEQLAPLFSALATTDRPTLDLVPLLPFAGWSTPRIAALEDLRTVLSSDAADMEPAVRLAEELNAARSGGAAANAPVCVAVLPEESGTGNLELPETSARVDARSEGDAMQWQHVAVGGTFDRLHAGHRILLAATALVTTGRVYIGVTGEKLLVSKKFGELLQPYADRAAAAAEYVRRLRPAVAVQTGELTDPMGMAAEIEEIEALVVSEETTKGADAINVARRERGFAPLAVVTVGLVGGQDVASKLSSTALRQAEAAQRARDAKD